MAVIINTYLRLILHSCLVVPFLKGRHADKTRILYNNEGGYFFFICIKIVKAVVLDGS